MKVNVSKQARFKSNSIVNLRYLLIHKIKKPSKIEGSKKGMNLNYKLSNLNNG